MSAELSRRRPSRRPSPKIRVAAVQMRSTRDLADQHPKDRRVSCPCAKDGARVVVFPECALTGYFDDAFMQAITAEQLADAERASGGMPAASTTSTQSSALPIAKETDSTIRPSSSLLKARFWRDITRSSLPNRGRSAGNELLVFKIDGVPASIIICHDERYPELVRLPVLAGARLVFYLSHESGLDKESKIAPVSAQIQARAVENTVYVVQANAPANPDATGSHGQSRLIAPDGNLIKEASMFGEEVVSATLDIGRRDGPPGTAKHRPRAARRLVARRRRQSPGYWRLTVHGVSYFHSWRMAMAEFNRRTFLRGNGCDCGTGICNDVRAADANDTVVLAIMGANSRGSQLADGFAKQPGVEIAYVCDCDERAIQKGIEAATSQRRPQAEGHQGFSQGAG